MHILPVGWFVSFLIFLGVGPAFSCLMSLWLAAGAIGRFAAALAGLPMEAQLAMFVAVSFLTLIPMCPVTSILDRWERAGGRH